MLALLVVYVGPELPYMHVMLKVSVTHFSKDRPLWGYPAE
jgi:hypothetical protein